MTQPEIRDRCRNMILGALVADAATMGLHWVYDQAHLAKLAPEKPEFMAPDAHNYAGVAGYFAHGTRTKGMQSQYGEQAMVMLRTLARGGDGVEDFAEAFRTHFGYGGAYVGYIDHATRDTLDNQRRYEDEALRIAEQLDPTLERRLRKSLVATALPLLARYEGEELAQRYLQAVDSDLTSAAQALLPALVALTRPTGSYDLQLPATAKLPPLVAALVASNSEAFSQTITASIRTTSDHPTAMLYGGICSEMMRTALQHGDRDSVIEAAQRHAKGDAADLLKQALSMRATHTVEQTTLHFGMACDLPYGVPSAVHNIATAPDFVSAIRRNILAGGDNCGRAILVGAVMGALYGDDPEKGIPAEWIAQTDQAAESEELIKGLLG